jgi:soluble lytic murein transglycosylase-like protein
MTSRGRTACLVLCLVSGLSCSLVPERAAGPAEDAADVLSGTQLEIEARLERMQTGLNAAERRATARAIADEAARNGLDVELVLAVIYIESAYHNFARSRVGALGLMQVMPATGEMLARQHRLTWNGAETLFDPVTNVQLGCRYLAALLERYGRIDAALAAYNWGPGAIDRRLAQGSGLPRKYSALVLAKLEAQGACDAGARRSKLCGAGSPALQSAQ